MIPSYFTGLDFSLLKIFFSNSFYALRYKRKIAFVYNNCTNQKMSSTSRIIKIISECTEFINKSIFLVTHIRNIH